MVIEDQVFSQAPAQQWVLSLYFRNHLLDFLVTRAKTFRDRPPADYDPLHPPLVKPGLESSKAEEETSGKLTTCRRFPTVPSHSLPRKRGRVRPGD